MQDPRTAKRRRVSDASNSVDEDGDIDMTTPQNAGAVSPTPTKPSTTEGMGTPTATATETPSRAGLRSSGRQRKAPQRYEDQADVAPSRTGSVRRTGTNSRRTPKAPAVTGTSTATEGVETTDADADADADPDMDADTPTRSALKSTQTKGSSRARRQETPDIESDDEDYKDDGEDQDDDDDEVEVGGEEEDEDEDEEYGSRRSRARKPASTSTKARSTRSNKSSVRFAEDDARNANAKAPTNGNGAADTMRESPADDYADGLDDLVAMQLQQDLARGGPQKNEIEETTVENLPAYAEQLQQFIRNGHANEVQLLTKMVIEKLNGKRLVPLKGLENEYHKVHQLLEQTVSVGEGNSMLVLGSRGAGKTAIIETVVSSLAREHKNDFHVVRLNGLLHTDDRLALREIWRQLGRETDTEEETGKVTSYADTMATLLALLSHPEELHGSAGNQDGPTTAKSIVIVLDEFDLFVTHPRQTLLYNLFDIAQARKAPLAVLGVTTKVDVTEMLEKRVKSRFSHRSVYVPLPRTYEVFSEACFSGLDLDLEDESGAKLPHHNAGELAIAMSNSWRVALDEWRGYLQGLWADPAFQAHLRRIYHQTKSVKEFFTSALMPITELHHSSTSTSSAQIPTPTTFATHTLSCPDPSPLPFTPSTSSSSSSSLPLSLLLAATRLTALYDPSAEGLTPQDLAPLALSFPAAYAEYVRLLTTAKTSASVSGASVTPGRVWGRDVAREAWERLVAWGLVSPVGGGSGTADGRMFRVEIAYEEVVGMIEGGAGSGGGLGRWWRDA